MTCEYCGSGLELGVDHVVPVSAMFSGRRSGKMKAYGETVICCRECNSLLGSKHYHTRHARALYLVECHAKRLQHYAEADQVYILNKLKTCIINYEAFLLSHLDMKLSDGEIAAELETEDPETKADDLEEEPGGEPAQLKEIRKKGIVDLVDLVGLSLADVNDIDDSVQVRDLFAKRPGEGRMILVSLIRRLSKANAGQLANFAGPDIQKPPRRILTFD